MELTLNRYLQDEGLREELERRAHQERAEEMHRYLAQAAQALSVRTPRATDARRSYAPAEAEAA
jgi:hypothetical protein